ncbi:related to OST3-oligosaccharyltransferase gamma subunit [Sporisorium reilianum f. sp. reilianum]|uniref:Related to OST3-oligosaccharyltransferase gamma subunit n=1 Tax=Sporisorium reilianum f. sp. reilianum TaxID=72559 RepID=A0A2N8UHX3_9BASI|nr:related to OST3-oligosaccharyltransferase gamma subunit [Sporisorium reilianum f. sp. reilianum]
MRASIVATMVKLGLLALLSLLALTHLIPGTLAQAFQSKEQSALFKRIQSSSAGYIDVDANEFAAIAQLPRDFAVTALLTTTTGNIKCPPCQACQPEFERLAQQWNRNKAVKAKNVFIKVEFSRAQQVFAQLQLQHAPVLYTFPVPTNANARPEHISFDFNERGFAAPDVAEHLNRILKTSFSYKRPLNRKLITGSVTGVIFVVGAVFFLGPYVPLLFQSSKPLWMLLCLGSMIVFNSGYMWNSIRGAPYIAMGQGGKPEYFAGGFQNQYGVETQIVAAIYSLLAFSFIALTVLVPAQRDPTRQRAGVYVWSAIFLATFSLLFYIFRTKNPSYPFRLFF